jgi:hypothetical protein
VAIFLGSNQLKQPIGTGAPTVAEGAIAPQTDFGWVFTSPAVAAGWDLAIGVGDSTSVTTGMVVAREVAVDVAAGTYTVSVQWKVSSGTLTAKERKLWVKAEGY